MNKLKSERANAGMSQEELAGKLGVARQTLARWEQGEDIPSQKVVIMASLFHCSADYLLGLSENRLAVS